MQCLLGGMECDPRGNDPYRTAAIRLNNIIEQGIGKFVCNIDQLLVELKVKQVAEFWRGCPTRGISMEFDRGHTSVRRKICVNDQTLYCMTQSRCRAQDNRDFV